ncbi:unnamed protein product [Strongylus vulgaris]|uniref:VWFA domain-containing protein n=1 Tax=Strongylus vulgaris TaxID=40348 RepID=A0A3P7JM39_STRVU|nr:unnamed protein product [Strongylus vulgaris]
MAKHIHSRALSRSKDVLWAGRQNGLRSNVKSVIIVYASDYRDGHFNDAKEVAEEIKVNGTNIIVIGFDQGGRSKNLERMSEIATPGYYYDSKVHELANKIQSSLCEVNCFCKNGWVQYTENTGSAVKKYGVCLKIGEEKVNWMLAKSECSKMDHGRSYLASELADSKHNFIAQMLYNTGSEVPNTYYNGLYYNRKLQQYCWEQPTGSKPLQVLLMAKLIYSITKQRNTDCSWEEEVL